MANGFCQGLLMQADEIVGNNLPTRKIGTNGLTKMLLCCQDSNASPINEMFVDGHYRSASVRYRERFLTSSVYDSDPGCDVAYTNPYKEFSFPDIMEAHMPVILTHDMIRQYCTEASQLATLPNASRSDFLDGNQARMMREVYNMVVDAAQAVVGKMNAMLVAAAATRFGVNALTGTNAVTSVSLDAGISGYTQAYEHIQNAIRENEICADNFCVVGNGQLTNKALLDKIWGDCCDGGVSTQLLNQNMPTVFYDKDTKTEWGLDHVGIFANGSAKLMSFYANDGNFGGKLANTTYTTFMLPVNEFDCSVECLEDLKFDLSIQEFDCAKGMNIDGIPDTSVKRGYIVKVSKYFGLFTTPDMYRVGDALAGTNGILRYAFSRP